MILEVLHFGRKSWTRVRAMELEREVGVVVRHITKEELGKLVD